MNVKNVPRLLVVAGLGLLLMIACSPAASGVDTENDDVAIYSSVIRQIVEKDDTFDGTLEKPVVYIIGTTDDSIAGDPTLPGTEPETLSQDVREGISAALSDLPSTITWVDNREEVELDENGGVADGGVIITLGNIHMQESGEAHVGGSIYIGNLAAGGQTYVLEQQDDAWVITGTTGPGWIS